MSVPNKPEQWLRQFYAYIDSPPELGELHNLAVARTRSMLAGGDYYIDEAALLRYFRFISVLRFSKGKFHGQPFEPLPWQLFAWGNVYGMKRQGSKNRLFTRGYITCARKQGKTEMLAAEMVYHAFFDGEPTAEVYCAANKYDQACILWRAAQRMCAMLAKDSPAFGQGLKVYDSITTRRLLHESSSSILAPLAAVSKTLDGLNPSAACLDEFAIADDDSILRVIASGMVARKNPYLAIITTRSFNTRGACFQLEKSLVEVVKGRKTDDQSFALIFSLDPDDDVNDRSVWKKSNPALGQTLTMETLEMEHQRAENEGASAMTAYLTKNQNKWVTSGKVWITPKRYAQNKGEVDDQTGRICWAGIDLASNRDLTCICLLFEKTDEGKYPVELHFFAPENGARKRAADDGVPYLDWAEAGELILTPGDETDYAYVEECVYKLAEKYLIQRVGYDPWHANFLAQRLESNGVETDKFGQTAGNFTAPIKWMERAFSQGEFVINSPIFDWMIENVQLRDRPGGLFMFDKKESKEKIDGVVALGMAVGQMLDMVDPNPVTEIFMI